jgi:signal transduction histidine kinase
VKDNGCGMTEEQLQNLFKPFYTTKEKGTGLGLVIVKKLLAAMNGSIKISSLKDVGTTIDIIVPRQKIEIAREANNAMANV